MAACLWYVLCLPAFFVPVLEGAVLECVASRFDKCEGSHMQRVRVAVDAGFGSPFFGKMCDSILCAAKECEEQWWYTPGDFVTQQYGFSMDAGLCGEKAKINLCAQKIAKKCLEEMARSVVKTSDYCAYYLTYAKCAIKELPACDDPVASVFADDMRAQIEGKLPLMTGDTTSRVCTAWS